MRRRSRTRRILKWVGLVGCVFVVVTWGGSAVRRVGLQCDTRNSRSLAHVEFGLLKFERYQTPGESPGTPVFSYHWWPAYALPWWPDRFGFSWPAFSTVSGSPSSVFVMVPCWLLQAVAAIPTAFLWYRDRRFPRNHCQQCGYDLMGNESGTCPECGEAIA
jgi:hypothetical protein